MLDLFRRNLFAYNIFLLAYCLILRVSWFFFDHPFDTDHAGILSSLLYRGIGLDHWSLKVLSMVLIIYQAFQVNRLVSLNRLTRENTLFPGLFYILLVSMTAAFIPLLPVLLANTFIIIMLMDVFKQTRNVALPINMFNVGLWAGLSSLFYTPYTIYLLLGMFGVLYLRTYKWLDTLRAILGFVVPYFLLCTVLFVSDDLSSFVSLHFADVFSFLDLRRTLTWQNYTVMATYGVIILMAVITSSTYSSGLNIHVRKKINVLFITMMGGLILMTLVSNTGIDSLIFLTIPLCVFMAAMFLELEKQFAEIIHFLLFIMAMSFQYLL